jgi:hypothetical protein
MTTVAVVFVVLLGVVVVLVMLRPEIVPFVEFVVVTLGDVVFDVTLGLVVVLVKAVALVALV